MIKILEKLHEAGVVHSDIKPDNILIGDVSDLVSCQALANQSQDVLSNISKEDMQQIKTRLKEIYLIDFGRAKFYMDQNGQHIPMNTSRVFDTNHVFASRHAFSGRTLSRRDDII